MQVSLQTAAGSSTLTKRTFATGFFVAVVAILLCYCILIQIGRMERIQFTTHDDMRWDLWAQEIKHVGFWRSYIPQAQYYATIQSRFNFYVTLIFCIFPYLFASPLIRALVIVMIHLSSLVALAYLVQQYLRPPFALLLLSVQLCFLQHSWDHYPIGAGPVVHHVPILLFSLGSLVYIRGMRRHLAGRVRLYYSTTAFGLLLVSLLFYEALSVVFLAIFTVVILAENRKTILEATSPVRAAFSSIVPLGLVMLIFLSTYAGYKSLHPSRYAGTVLQMNSWQSFQAAAKVLTHVVTAGLPGMQAWTQDDMMRGLTIGPLRQEAWGAFLTDNLGVLDVFQALLLTAALIGYRQFVGHENQRFAASPMAVLVTGSLAMFCAVLASLPVALTEKYQREQVSAYVTSYFGYLSFTVFIALIVSLVCVAHARHKKYSTVAFAVLLVGLFAISILTNAANNAIVRSQIYYASKWRLMDAVLRTSIFQKLQEPITILSPEMWQGVYLDDDYWSKYIHLRTNKNVQLVKTLPPQLREGSTVIYLSFDLARSDGACCAVLLPINFAGLLTDPEGVLVGGKVYVIGDRDIHNGSLSYESRPPSTSAKGPLEIPSTPVYVHADSKMPDFRSDNGAYVTDLSPQGGIVAGSTGVTIRPVLTIPRREAVEMIFGDGFYGTEGVEGPGNDYWRWNGSPTGQGQITLYNHTMKPLGAQLQAVVEVATPKMTQFDIAFGTTTETVWANNGGYSLERILVLNPGPNVLALKSYAKHFHVPPDPRDLVFRVRDWRLRLLNDAEMAAALKKARHPLDLDFSQGFWAVEGNEGTGNYWRWSDSPSRSATITIINRTERNLRAAFQARVETGVPTKTNFEVVASGIRRTLLVDAAGANLVVDLVAKPGRNEILLKSDAPRVQAPNDPRYLTFRVVNWKLTY